MKAHESTESRAGAVFAVIFVVLAVGIIALGYLYYRGAEVYAPLRERLWMALCVVGALLVGWVAVLWSLWRQHCVRFYREQYEAAEALRASEVQYRRLFESAKDGILILDAETGDVIDANPFLADLLGFPLDQLLGKKVWELGFLKDVAANQAKFQELQWQGYVRYEDLPLEAANGQRVHVEFVSNVYEAGRRQVIQCNIRDITARKRAEHAMEKRSDDLMRFTHAVSQDLKSPVLTIKTFLDYLEQDTRNQDAVGMRKDLGYIHTAADTMLRRLDELLELSRTGRKANLWVDASLQAIVQEALDLEGERIAARGVAVQVTEEPVQLCGDRSRLVEVFQSLLDNAAKFMGDQATPRVEIGVETKDTEKVFFVRDNGIGIDPRQQPRLFGLFEKLNPAIDGTGLGLALTKRIVEVHGGRIWLDSAGLGKGTTFRFTLNGAVKAA